MIGDLLVGRYRISETLGEGGMGRTYIAQDMLRPGYPKCVVKQLQPASNAPQFLEIARRLFNTEAETLEHLGNHPQIPRLLAYFEQEQEFFLVQEFIEGHSLRQELPFGERWPEARVVQLLDEILTVLVFVHGQNVIHRDIKPDNIIRRKADGKLVLIDFGAVKQLRVQQPTAVGQASVTVAIGTPGYMPTEQSSGKPRFSSDIYALGMVGIQALTGMPPTHLDEDENGELIWLDYAEVSDGLAAVLSKMVRHYFKHRYQSAAEALDALRQINEPTLIVAPTATPVLPPPTEIQLPPPNLAANLPVEATPLPSPDHPVVPSTFVPAAVPAVSPEPAPSPLPVPTGLPTVVNLETVNQATPSGAALPAPALMSDPTAVNRDQPLLNKWLLLGGGVLLLLTVAGVAYVLLFAPDQDPQPAPTILVPTPSPEASPTPTPKPSPSPTPTPRPAPSPTPRPTPAPEPAPAPAPPSPVYDPVPAPAPVPIIEPAPAPPPPVYDPIPAPAPLPAPAPQPAPVPAAPEGPDYIIIPDF